MNCNYVHFCAHIETMMQNPPHFTQIKHKKNNFFYALLWLSFCALAPQNAFAQLKGEQSIDELVEMFLRDNEVSNESDAREFVESLENLQDHPLDLNKASREELVQTRIITEMQAENLILYRNLLGNLISFEELQAVPGFEADDVRRIRPFVEVKAGLDNRRINLWKWAGAAKNDLFLRLNLPSSSSFDPDWEGNAKGYFLRYRGVYENRMRYGFTAEKDPGEAFFKGSNPQGFDFYSAHFFLYNPAQRLKTLALGDFSARFGQGLLLQPGFAIGKSAEAVSIIRGGRTLSPYGASGEALFFRGGGITVNLTKHIEATVFGSLRARDANIVLPEDTLDLDAAEITFSSLQNSGLHRLPTEIDDEKSIKEKAAGANITYSNRRTTLGVNALYIGYDKNLNGPDAPYRRFYFSGNQLVGASVNYSHIYRNLLFFGEVARSDNGGIATVNGLIVSPDRKLSFAMLHRDLGRNYQAVYAAPFAESNSGSNEKGLYFGFQFKPVKGWQLDAYTDTWKTPWLKFGVDAPSDGQEYLCRLTWTKKRKMTASLTWFYEQKQVNEHAIEAPDFLVVGTRSRIRGHVAYILSPGVELRTRVEKTFYNSEVHPNANGYLAFQDVILKRPGKPFSINLRYAIFDTDDYNTRVYTYENDISASVSIPTFSGLGTRFFAAGSWRLRKYLILEARWGQTYIARAGSGSAKTGTFDDVRLQMRFKF